MNLKIATLEDKEAVVNMAYSFYNTSPYRNIPIDGVKVVNTVSGIITSDLSLCLLGYPPGQSTTPCGVIAGHVSETIFSSEKMASEIMWWIEPEHRGSPSALTMIEAFEYWAKLKGCRYVQMSLLSDEIGIRLGKYYTKRGYLSTEKAYIKEI